MARIGELVGEGESSGIGRERGASGNSLVVPGYLCGLAALMVFPPALGLAGFAIGIMNLAKGKVGHGIFQIVIAVTCGLVGVYLGVMGVTKSSRENQFQGQSSGDTTEQKIREAYMEEARQKYALLVEEREPGLAATALGDALLITSDWNARQRERFATNLTSGGACDVGFKRVRFTSVNETAAELVLQCK